MVLLQCNVVGYHIHHISCRTSKVHLFPKFWRLALSDQQTIQLTLTYISEKWQKHHIYEAEIHEFLAFLSFKRYLSKCID